MYLALQDTHNPAEAPRIYLDAVDASAATGITDPVRRILAAKLAVVDEAVANVTRALRQNQNMLANTVIVYTTDNAGPIVPSTGAPDDAVGASNWPLRGGKHTAYEGGVRATAWIWDGRGILHPMGSRDLFWNGLMHAVDWLPTICKLAHCKPFPEQPDVKYGLALDGVDVSEAVMSNGSSPRKSVVLDIEKHAQGVVRIDRWKLMSGYSSTDARPGDWSNSKPWENVTASEPTIDHGILQLFDVVADPSERMDLVNNTDLPEDVLNELLTMLQAELAVAVYPFSLGPKGSCNGEGVWEPWLNETDLWRGRLTNVHLV